MDLLTVLKCRLEIIDDSITTKQLIDELVSFGPLEAPVHLTELDNVVKRHYQWVRHLSAVHPFYTVRTNNDLRILGTTVLLDCGYVCSSKIEVMQVLELGVDPEWILLKSAADSDDLLKFAQRKRLLLSFSTERELRNIHHVYSEAELLICFGYELDPDAEHQSQIETHDLLNLAKELEMDVIGWSYEPSSVHLDHTTLHDAIRKGREITDFAMIVGFNFNFINIGNGLSIHKDHDISQYAAQVNRSLQDFFPDRGNFTIVAESGPFHCAAAVTAISTINGKRVFWHPEFPSQIERVSYYLNHDFGDESSRFEPIIWKSPKDCGTVCRSSLYASSNECLIDNLALPEVNEMDCMVFENQGASTSDLAEMPVLPITLAFVRKSMWNFLKALSTSDNPRRFILTSQYLSKEARIERLRYD
ncbi:AAEL005694-PA [Aedes aegypti]|uniref:AAEL005694-PA n=1 Tax=Aedes aegypti TaxID=7159 RepID=Q179A8_AEDAE|nr:AAEL005694-PA [Aedes aegypti]